MSVKKSFLLFVLLAVAVTKLAAQRMQFRNYNVGEGLSQSQVYDIAEDQRGRLLLATRGGGVSVYDGLGFSTITRTQGLSDNFVYCFYKDPKQHLWIGTNNGLNDYDGQTIRKYYPENLGEQVWLLQIAGGSGKRLWLASRVGLLLFENGRFRNISAEQNQPKYVCNTVFTDGDSLVYFGNDLGLFCIRQQDPDLKISKVPCGITDPRIAITGLHRSSNGNLFVASYGYGLFQVVNGQLQRPADDIVPRNEKILNLFEDHGTLYLATMENGVISYNLQSHRTEVLNVQKGLANNHVRKIYKDRSDNLWLGTSGGGVSNYAGQLFSHIDKYNGLPDNFIYAVLQAAPGKLLLGAGNSGLTILYNDSLKVLSASHGFYNTKVKCLRKYNEQVVLVGTEGEGLFLLEADSLRPVQGLGRQFIKDVQVDQQGSIWLATAGNGIYRLKPESLSEGRFDIRQFSTQLINPRIQFLNTEVPGKVFYCTENQGIGLIEAERPTAFRLNTSTGLASNLTRSMVVSKGNIAWIATADKGLCAYNLGRKKVIPVNNSKLPSLNIYLMRVDKKGNLVIGTERGLDYVVVDSQQQVVQVKHYGRADGFLGIETCLNAISDNEDGSYWIGTINGATLYNPAKGTSNPRPPLLSFTGLKLFYKPVEETKYGRNLHEEKGFRSLVLPYKQNHLTFEFEGINLRNGEAVRYSWKLEPFDTGWSPAANQHSATYSNLPPGKYTLLVKSCNEDGVWNERPLRYSFEILRPFWWQWWFLATLGGLLLLLIWLIIRWRTQRIKKEAAEKERELKIAHQLQSLEHKALRLQMNPHFIFNALNSIQGQVGNGNDQEARYYIAKFGKLMRQILNHSEQTWVTVKEEADMIENYLMLEQFCHNKIFNYEVHLEPVLVEEEYKIPSMIIQPFIENAIVHGFRNLRGRSAQLSLKLYLQQSEVVCMIEDNGVGRAVAAEHKRNHQSMAIGITRKRLQLLHEQPEQEFVTITDLVSDGAPAGTKVTIILPAQ